MPRKPMKTRATAKKPVKKPAKKHPKSGDPSFTETKGTFRTKRNAALTGKPAGKRTRSYTIVSYDSTPKKRK